MKATILVALLVVAVLVVLPAASSDLPLMQMASEAAPLAAVATPVTFDCSGVTQIPQIECEALVALYNSTNGPGWTFDDGWLTYDHPPCSWYHVSCDNGHVGRIILEVNNLSGPISSEIANLTYLRDFDLEANQLTGAIPPELGRLANLSYFDLASNQLTGTIPPELGRLANLSYLRLSGNQLMGGVPAELGNLAKLGVLYLQENQDRKSVV